MENNLTFITTQSVGQFKTAQGVEKLEAFRDLETSAISFVCGAARGAVSKQIKTDRELFVSRVIGDETDAKEFLLLHNASNKELFGSF